MSSATDQPHQPTHREVGTARCVQQLVDTSKDIRQVLLGQNHRPAGPPQGHDGFLIELPIRAQDGVAVDAQRLGKLGRRRKTLADSETTLGDLLPQRRRDLIVERRLRARVDVDLDHT